MRSEGVIALLAGLALLVAASHQSQPRPAPPAPIIVPVPTPTPPKKPCPGPGPCPPRESWEASVGGTVAPDGQEIDIDLPMSQQLHNKGGSDGPRGPGSGSGLCVFTSVNNAANWQGVQILRDLRDWMTHYPGGGTPDKLDKMIKRKCAEAGVPVPPYIQVEGLDLAILKEACKGGRMPSVTYSYSPTGRYDGKRIQHMVNIANAGNYYAVLDNNFVCTPEKPNNYEWLSEAEFVRSHKAGGAWSVILLEPGPAPLPRGY